MMESERIFLLGAASMVGSSVVRQAGSLPLVPFCGPHARANPRWQRLRLEDDQAPRRLFANEAPALLIHCGAVCDVDKLEAAPRFAWRLNVDSVQTLLESLPGRTRLVYCSSDHVFSGDSGPYDERSPVDPITVYGRSRVAAEELVRRHRPDALILRMGLAVGPSLSGRTGHLDWLCRRHAKALPITVVSDEHRSAVWATDLGERILSLAHSTHRGTRHIAAAPVSRPRLAAYLNEHFSIGAHIDVESRRDRSYPHLGRVELRTVFQDTLAAPLPRVVPASWRQEGERSQRDVSQDAEEDDDGEQNENAAAR